MIKWRHDPSSAYHAEQAIVGDFKLVVVALPHDYLGPPEIVWEMFGPPGWQTFLATGKAKKFDSAKAATEQALEDLLKPS